MEVLAKHNLFYDRIYSRIGSESIVADEFYDVVLEIASYAKKHLEAARAITPLPNHAHRAFLLALEADYYLERL
jgi:hypothetical protein